ncbi:CocE/NonD family hydrolase [Sphingobacterium oryzagri]|uniref:CocE/NonD family hydrolase n=1 Tax=Sphingobacterium oryzagri TaxID=3025669 RepID=A0ABY7WJN0_9SPHI|nr:CocE/NonD family hydrolase [Sphingobacterium sp. KACC 22765]WDF69782.1 CocE/NonD family hydrolase [Sphingobacterium sp. KACC 22765]
MKRLIFTTFLSLFLLFGYSQEVDEAYVKNNYTKIEEYITMRDGVRLFTSIYIPKNTDQKYPIMLNRTPYTVAPYGTDDVKAYLGNFPEMTKAGYIFVYQDVRGRWMSEGTYENIRPTRSKANGQKIDESTDTYDTIDWLVKNVQHNNGKVGMYGISYPGFYSTASLIGSHPALKAVSPQAPVTDWFIGDDFHHGGALFLMDAFRFMYSFDAPRPKPITNLDGPKGFQLPTKDYYQFFLANPTLSGLKSTYLDHTVKFWDDLAKHSVRDTFWTSRTITEHLGTVKPAVLVVGGLFDAEDTYGAFETYKKIEEHSPKNNSVLVAGPWYHGGWVRAEGDYFGDIRFGEKTSVYYRKEIELPFFEYHLKGKGKFEPAEATIYVTGSNAWKKFQQWPPVEGQQKTLFMTSDGQLRSDANASKEDNIIYHSDPNKPVPFQEGVITDRTREYMVADQRFVANRPDVLVFQTEVLSDDLTIVGPVLANLTVSMTGTDADFVVKLIDVYPDSSTATSARDEKAVMQNYQMLVRGEVLRGKFRDSYSEPKAFVPNEKTPVTVKLPDVAHTFKKGHRLMVQIQHSWFPLVDRNPNQFMDIYQAQAKDFIKNEHRLYFSKDTPSSLTFEVIN